MQLEGKVTLVTGAGRGIGKSIAIGFARQGANVVAVSRTLSEVEDIARTIKAMGMGALAIQADVSRVQDVISMTEQVQNRFNRLDVLVNNAALRMNHLGNKDSYLIPFTDLTVE